MERRFWYGSAILVFFLVLGLLVAWGMENMQRPVTGKLEQAAQAALDGDMEQGIILAQTAKDTWQRHRDLTAAVADHAPMEEIDSLFAQVEVYAQSEKTVDFAAYCTRLARLVEAVGEAHALTWQNLL